MTGNVLRRRRFLRVASLGGVSGATGCLRFSQESGSATDERTRRDSGDTPDGTTQTATDQRETETGHTASLSHQWTVEGAADELTNHGGNLFGFRPAEAFRIDPSSGSVSWSEAAVDGARFDVPETEVNDCFTDDAFVVAARSETGPGAVVALDKGDGSVLWTHEGNYEYVAVGSAIADGHLVCGSSVLDSQQEQGEIFSLDPANGSVNWSRSFPGRIADFEFDGTTAYAWGVNTAVYTFDATTGGAFEKVDDGDGYLALANGKLFTKSPLNLWVYDLDTYESETNLNHIPQAKTPFRRGESLLYLGTVAGVYAIDPDEQAVAWRQITDDAVTALDVRGGYAWAITESGTVLVLAEDDGSVVVEGDLLEMFDFVSGTNVGAQSRIVAIDSLVALAAGGEIRGFEFG